MFFWFSGVVLYPRGNDNYSRRIIIEMVVMVVRIRSLYLNVARGLNMLMSPYYHEVSVG